MKLHTDTNIWYSLNLTENKTKELKSIGISGNYLNIFELTKTDPNDKLENVLNAYKNFVPFFDTIIGNTSLINCIKVGTGIAINEPNNRMWVDEFKAGCGRMDVLRGYSFTESQKQENREYTNKLNETYKIAVASWNYIFEKCREEKQKISKYDIYIAFNLGVKAQLGFELPQVEFYKRELFLKVFVDFANEIIENTTHESGKRDKMSRNDMIDLL